VRFNISDPSIPLNPPHQCTPPEFGGCGRVHTHKTHHLNLDDTGAVIVDAALYRKIQAHLIAFGFVETNEVPNPPAQGIGLGPASLGGQWGNVPVVAPERSR
jgi:hypothetical protein